MLLLGRAVCLKQREGTDSKRGEAQRVPERPPRHDVNQRKAARVVRRVQKRSLFCFHVAGGVVRLAVLRRQTRFRDFSSLIRHEDESSEREHQRVRAGDGQVHVREGSGLDFHPSRGGSRLRFDFAVYIF